ncbi:MAG: ParA family protein, partial [Halobaculum sp.]
GDESSDATAGRAVAVPAAAAFERFARAKSADASERLETRLRAATDRFDHVICDVPPVGANPHVAAVTTADRRVAVAPGTDHGADARRRLADRLADLDCTLDATLAVGDSIPAADATIPDGPPSVADAPATLHDPRFAERVIAAAETTLGVTCDVTVERDGPLDRVRDAI